ncbi:AraC family transcriptional regulator [Rhodopseudomonas palustris]|uniref:Transcriptional regulator, AraC family n=1 Tax=Rhodopseudomonas palustris (strain BisB18) TaxID=316056 RepID=Q21CY9_RHOPB
MQRPAVALAKSTNPIDYQTAARPIVAMPKEFAAGSLIASHHHARAQLIYAVSGVMEIRTKAGLWLVPPQRALWMPAELDHAMRCRGAVSLRTLYLRADGCPADAPAAPRVVQVSILLRELILRIAGMPLDGDASEHDGRILALLFDEIGWAPDQELFLPMPRDARLARLCEEIVADPGDTRSLAQWAGVAGASSRTISRLFRQQFGCSFQLWRQQAKLLAALPRLAANEAVITIAGDLGYETPAAFAAMFRRLTGTTPSRYFG